MAARHGRFIEVAAESLVEEVLARLQPIFEA